MKCTKNGPKWQKLFFVGFCRGVEISEGHEIFFLNYKLIELKSFFWNFFISQKFQKISDLATPPQKKLFFVGGRPYLAVNWHVSQHAWAF